MGTLLKVVKGDDSEKPEKWLERAAAEKRKDDRNRAKAKEVREREDEEWNQRSVGSPLSPSSSKSSAKDNSPRINTNTNVDYKNNNYSNGNESTDRSPNAERSLTQQQHSSPTSSNSPNSPINLNRNLPPTPTSPPPPPLYGGLIPVQSITNTPTNFGNSKNAKYTKAEEARNRARRAAGLPELPPAGAPPPKNPVLFSLSRVGIPVPTQDKKPERWLEKMDKQRRREEAIAIISGTEDKWREEQQQKVPEYMKIRHSNMYGYNGYYDGNNESYGNTQSYSIPKRAAY